MKKKLYYKTKDGIKLCGILSIVNDSKEILIMCHGLMGDKNNSDHFLELTDELNKNQINSFRFDFRAHGESEGIDYEMTPLKEMADLETTIELLESMGFQYINILGASFGVSVISSLDFTKYPQIKKLILWYGLLDFTRTTTDFFLESSKKVALEIGYKKIESKRIDVSFKLGKALYKEIETLTPYQNLLNLNLPILFVHGTADITIPYQLSQDIANKCKKATIKLIEGEYHAFRKSKDGLKEAIESTVKFIKNNT